MKNAQKPEKIALGALLNQLREGRFVIPDFQREFEWKPWDIRDLLKSILLDYYIGTMLLWRGKDENFENLSCEPIYGHREEQKPDYIVLDGQQRLTAMYYAFFAPDITFPNRKSPCSFYVRLDKFQEENYDECIEYQFIGQKWRQINETPKELYARHLFPFKLLGDGQRAVIHWLDGYASFWTEKAEAATANEDTAQSERCQAYAIFKEHFDSEIAELERDYQISYIELDKELAVEKVCDIFTQINSKGIRLDIFDLLNAMLKPKDIQLKAMWRSTSDKLGFIGTPKMNVYVLQVMSIMLQAYCSAKYLYFLIPGQQKTIRHQDGTKEQIVLLEDKSAFLKYWEHSVDALKLAIEALSNPRDYGAIKSAFIPYPSIVPAFSAIRRHARRNGLLKRVDVNQKIRKWYWASVFTSRYSSAVESTSAQDFIALKKWFDDDEVVPVAIRDFEDTFRNLDLVNENIKGTAIYNAILNLLIINGAKDLGSFQYPEYGELDDHHIVPASWGRENVGSIIHSVLNKTPISAETNRKILSNRLPNEYLQEMFAENDERAVRDILETHYISERATEILLRDPFEKRDYEEFIEERKKSLLDGIEHHLIEQTIKTSIPNKELNEAIEKLELRLRQVIADELGDDPKALPQHLLPKARERIDGVLRRDRTRNSADFESTSTVLEYFDLRELEDTIKNKSNWNLFEAKFGKKETLQQRFAQLCELRNALRHSRTVDDVVKMEGEAAVIWFNKLLGV